MDGCAAVSVGGSACGVTHHRLVAASRRLGGFVACALGVVVRKVTQIFGWLLAAASCVPVWKGLEALEAGDHLGAVLAAFMAWVLGRAAVELTLGGNGGALPGREGSHGS